MPIFSISFCLTSPVEWAIALGGVLIGRHIAHEAAMAIPIRIAEVPPMIFKESPMPWQTTARIGINRAAVAVFEIKLACKYHIRPDTACMTMGYQLPKGI